MKYDFYTDPFAMLKFQTQATLMAMEASAVIWMRVMGWAGVWSVLPSENSRMVTEKQKAFQQAGTKLVLGAMQGQEAAKTLSQAIKPIRRTTKSNVGRLAKRGPKRK
ncbi:antifreeze protein [Cribrihabitans neustonicus]|uniref:antifreeze protein n=1 Tax=Cribrihabitans neustonicus TaxID=1429085 RepID=UPI003B5C3C90